MERSLRRRHVLRAALAIISTAWVVGCAAPQPSVAILYNRTGVALALAPGVVVPACTDRAFTQDELDKAATSYLNAPDDSWVPPGAANLGLNVLGDPRPKNGGPLSVVVPGGALPWSVDGPIASGSLPACGGTPMTE